MDVSESGYWLDAVQMFPAQPEMQILPTFENQSPPPPPPFEDANFVPSSLIMKPEERFFEGFFLGGGKDSVRGPEAACMVQAALSARVRSVCGFVLSGTARHRVSR